MTPVDLEVRLESAFRQQIARRPSPSEMRSWSSSLPVLAHDLIDAGLADVEVLVEYRLPLTSKRADVVLAGRHPRTGRPSFVVVELKQWSQVDPFPSADRLVLVPGMPGGPRLHPQLQVAHYCEYLVDFTSALQGDSEMVCGAAYLHNATRSSMGVPNPQVDIDARTFTGDDRGAFIDFLRSRLDTNKSGATSADLLLRSAIAPSRQLMKVVAEELADRQQFVLLDEQQVAFDLVRSAVEQSRRADRKTVVIVTGGPGSGKSVIALSLVGALSAQGRTVVHATGSRAFTLTLRAISGYRKQRAANIFRYFNSFMDTDRNGIEVLVLDEAHRLRQTSENRYTAARLRTGRPQIDELISAARVPVFLLDENQVVRPGEMGTAKDIRDHAGSLGLDVIEIALDAQFRCGGSQSYVEWVERLLGLRDDGPSEWVPDGAYSIDVVDSPEELEARLASYGQRGFGARMTAGYCWPWSDPTADGQLVSDVQIGQWSRPWNSRSERPLPGAPPAPLWATGDGGFGQVGCVYTAQGFEYDWNGVILGPDLVWRSGHWESRRAFNKDPDFRSAKTVSDGEFDRLVRHVYKVLLTRGMVGTLLFAPDPETREFLRSLVPLPLSVASDST